ncbi:hypothetical protein Clacol_001263 [Clathrus columnatus]|uniref:DUF676 domain-containing protein n=1 Tax=Clathrus columnatus TaxID=1419009 RepID=A0AAV4ZXY5_9AGAM|nr:hypothetical protein Clacol_001263 [Clathrus columnatus]
MSEAPLAAELPQELLLCIFIHGTNAVVAQPDSRTVAVERFADWLTTLTVEKEVSHGSGGGAGKAKIVLCGHSMGGLLAADTFLAMAHARPDKTAPLWPRIIACLAFDTPYLGIHPHVFKNTATKALGYMQTAKDVATSASILGALGGFAFGRKVTDPNTPTATGSTGLITAPPPGTPPGEAQPVKRTGWQRWAPIAYGAGAAVLAGAAASTAYYKREEVTFGWTWATDHMKYVKNLWDEKTLKDRIENVVNTGAEVGVLFKTFYTYIPGKPPANPIPRTFVILPPTDSPYRSYFAPAHNTIALDEISAHTSMFQAGSNDGYYELGLLTAQAIRDGIMLCKDL